MGEFGFERNCLESPSRCRTTAGCHVGRHIGSARCFPADATSLDDGDGWGASDNSGSGLVTSRTVCFRLVLCVNRHAEATLSCPRLGQHLSQVCHDGKDRLPFVADPSYGLKCHQGRPEQFDHCQISWKECSETGQRHGDALVST